MNALRISEAVSLAIHSLVLLAQNGREYRKVKELAQEIGVSEAHLAKVFQRLARVGLVESVRGPQGGFQLARPKESISLLEIYEAIEGPVSEERECLLHRKHCPFGECVFGGVVEKVNREFRTYLASKTLLDIAKGG